MNPYPTDVDESAIGRLNDIGGNRLVGELVATFLRNTPTRIADAREALAAGNLDKVMRVGHSLKSSSANVGANALREVAASVEQAGLDRQGERLGALVEQMALAFEAIRPGLEARVASATCRPCIAVVEDNPDNRMLVRAMLEDRYEIREYESGTEALAGIAATPPALVLLDVSLPGMDGVQVLSALRASAVFRRLPVVALTAHAMAGDREKYISAGFDDYVAKPIVDERVLTGAIERLLGR